MFNPNKRAIQKVRTFKHFCDLKKCPRKIGASSVNFKICCLSHLKNYSKLHFALKDMKCMFYSYIPYINYTEVCTKYFYLTFLKP